MASSASTPASTAPHRVLVLGCGLVCPPLLEYLSGHGYLMTVACRSVSKASAVIAGLGAERRSLVRPVSYDIDADSEAGLVLLSPLVSSHELTVSLLPYVYHVRAARVCLAARRHFFTTSYVSAEMAALSADVRAAGLCFLNEAGLDPGLDHMSAQRFIDRVHAAGGRIASFLSICGGLPSPAANDNPLQYKLSWSPRGVLLASRNTATYLHNGELRTVSGAALYEEGVGFVRESVELAEEERQQQGGGRAGGEGGEGGSKAARGPSVLHLERYPNRDSTVYGGIYGIPEAHTLLRGTYRNAGWCDMMRVLSLTSLTSTDTAEADRTYKAAAARVASQQAGGRENGHSAASPAALSLAQFTYSVVMQSSEALPQSLREGGEEAMQAWLRQHMQARHALAVSADVLRRLSYLGLLSVSTALSGAELRELPSALSVLCLLFERHLQYAEGEEDMCVLRHTFEVDWPQGSQGLSEDGEREREMLVQPAASSASASHSASSSWREQWTSQLVAYGPVRGGGGKATRYSSMARTVSLPVGVCIVALLSGRWSGAVQAAALQGVTRPTHPAVYGLVLEEMQRVHGIGFTERRQPTTLWLRSESKPGEHRTPLTPSACLRLQQSGQLRLTVEASPHRCIADSEYAQAGCRMVQEGSWQRDAPHSAVVIGLKELEDSEQPLHHRHVYFAHCYKQQQGWDALLRRFVKEELGDLQPEQQQQSSSAGAVVRRVKGVGKGVLWDLEYLTDSSGRRVAAFGRAAGLVGMALGIMQWCCQQRAEGDSRRQLPTPLQPWPSIDAMVRCVRDELQAVCGDGRLPAPPTVLVLGALGRCGAGCVWLCREVGLPSVISWDMAETAAGGPFPSLCSLCDILVNAIYLSPAASPPPFLTQEVLEQAEQAGERRLQLLLDVSCDTSNPHHPFPFYSTGTTLQQPTLSIALHDARQQQLPLTVIAIDHLPALIPNESSSDFSQALEPLLPALHSLHDADTSSSSQHTNNNQQQKQADAAHGDVWLRAEAIFHDKVLSLLSA
jgi:saccharopine dehydrogenase (NAD+, L-lysine-forming)